MGVLRLSMVAVLVLAALTTGVAGASVGGPATGTADRELGASYVLSLTPDDPGHVDVTVRFDVPRSVERLSVDPRADAEVTDSTGFERSGGAYEWTGETQTPSLTYRKSVNVSVGEGMEGRPTGGYLYVDTGEWALVRAPSVAMRYATREPVTVDRTVSVDGEGVTGRSIAYLGPHETYTSRAAGQRFRLVVPRAADLAELPDAVLDVVGRTAERVSFGPRDERVTMFAAPSRNVTWGSTGLQRGEADLWVRDVQRLDTAENVWVHEYVHTRQSYRPTAESRWTVEATADYYAALYTYEAGETSYDRFRRHLREGRADRFSGAVLTEPSTWEGTRAAYWKGSLVLGALDRRIRLTSDGTLQDVFDRVADERELTQEEFLAAVETVGGRDARSFAARYTETSEAPVVWNRSEHRRAFGPTATFTTEFRRPFTVAGAYRSGDLPDDGPVAPGETVAVTATVRNVGDADGSHEATLYVDDTPHATREVTVDAGASSRVRFEVPVSETGTRSLRLGEAETTVEVVSPARASVTGLSVPSTAAPDRPVPVQVELRNDADRPATRTVDVRVDGSVVESRTVRLGPDATVTATVNLSLSEGDHRVSVADRTATVEVRQSGAQPTSPGERSGGTTPSRSSGAGSGFGVAAALAALAFVLALALAGGVTSRR